MMLAALLLVLSSEASEVDRLLEAARRPTGASASPAAVVLVQPSERPSQLLRLHRTTRWNSGVGVSAWTVDLALLDRPGETRETSSDRCPALAAQADKLETLGVGRLLGPPDLSPPRAALHATLYTVSGSGRQTDGTTAYIEVRTSSGPVAEWAAAMHAIVRDCLERSGAPR